LVYWRGDTLSPRSSRQSCLARKSKAILAIYFLRDFGFGARCDSALAAATFAGFELFGLFNTDEAAFAARALVLRWAAIRHTPFCFATTLPVASGYSDHSALKRFLQDFVPIC
jgi:hypothetical protein